MSLTHLANNALGGSSTPLMGNRPLTTLGRQMLDAMGATRMAVDVAHASARTFEDTLRSAKVRVFCSHTGLRTAYPSWRNLTDAQLGLLADRGGVIGIIFGTVYLGGRQIADVVRHVEHGLRVAGEDAIAFGSDFDGMVPLPRGMRDAADLPRVVEALGRKLPARLVEKVAFGNWRRFFGEILGPGPLSSGS